MRHGVAGWQLHMAGGNLVTGSGYGMNPLTGEWEVNAFPDRTDDRLRDDFWTRESPVCRALRRVLAHHHGEPPR
jgi:hypothetical protein